MYEQGRREPDFEMQEAIADFFNVDLDYIMGRTNVKKAINFLSFENNVTSYSKEFIDEATNFYMKYLSADKKTRKMIDMLLEEGE